MSLATKHNNAFWHVPLHTTNSWVATSVLEVHVSWIVRVFHRKIPARERMWSEAQLASVFLISVIGNLVIKQNRQHAAAENDNDSMRDFIQVAHRLLFRGSFSNLWPCCPHHSCMTMSQESSPNSPVASVSHPVTRNHHTGRRQQTHGLITSVNRFNERRLEARNPLKAFSQCLTDCQNQRLWTTLPLIGMIVIYVL